MNKWKNYCFINLFKFFSSSIREFEMRGFSWTVVRVIWEMLSSVHHLCHVGHPLRKEGGVFQISWVMMAIRLIMLYVFTGYLQDPPRWHHCTAWPAGRSWSYGPGPPRPRRLRGSHHNCDTALSSAFQLIPTKRTKDCVCGSYVILH